MFICKQFKLFYKMGNYLNTNSNEFIEQVIEKCSEEYDYDEHLLHLLEPVSYSKPISELKKQIQKIKPPGDLRLYVNDKLIDNDNTLIGQIIKNNVPIKFEVEPSLKDILKLTTMAGKVKEHLQKNNENISSVSLDFGYNIQQNRKMCSFYHVVIPHEKYLELRTKGHHNFFKEYPPRIKLSVLDDNLSGTIRIEYLHQYGKGDYFEL
jgi:hypothetical protein